MNLSFPFPFFSLDSNYSPPFCSIVLVEVHISTFTILSHFILQKHNFNYSPYVEKTELFLDFSIKNNNAKNPNSCACFNASSRICLYTHYSEIAMLNEDPCFQVILLSERYKSTHLSNIRNCQTS